MDAPALEGAVQQNPPPPALFPLRDEKMPAASFTAAFGIAAVFFWAGFAGNCLVVDRSFY